MKKLLLTVLAITMTAGFSLTAASCGKTDDGKTLKVMYVNWADGVAITNLAKVILEQHMGYNVELTMADVGPVYASVAQGAQDMFLDAWLPATHEPYMKKFGDKLVDLGPNYTGCKLGLVVPTDAPGDAIADLAGLADSYNGQIVGIDGGAGIMRQTQQAIEAYNLDVELVQSSETAMLASLKTAVDKDEPVVVTGWKPHWKFARWDLRFLDDPKGVYGEAESIHSIVRTGFEADHPDVTAFLKRFKLTDAQLSELMAQIKDSDDDPSAVARAWAKANPEAVKKWLGE